MKKLPKISIIMPSYNQILFLEEAIFSIISQKYSNLEFILIDGGSNDGSIEIIKKYEEFFSYWHSKPDDGQTDAIIQGINHSTGDLLCWVNSDDVLLPNTLRYVSNKYLENSEAGIFFGNYFLINQFGRITKCKRVPNNKIEWFAKRGYWVFNSIGTFFSRNAYESVGGLKKELSYVMDADLFIRILLNGAKYKHVGKYVAGFRRHSEAKTVFNAKISRREHYYAAKKYWPVQVAKGRMQMRWKYIYWFYQIINGNIGMWLDSFKYHGKKWNQIDWSETVERKK